MIILFLVKIFNLLESNTYFKSTRIYSLFKSKKLISTLVLSCQCFEVHAEIK